MPDQQHSPADSLTSGSSSGKRMGPRLAPLGQIPIPDYSSVIHVTRRKRETISVACGACQKRKSKCDGGRPICFQCTKKNTSCEYSADLRRNSNLRELTTKLHAQVKQYEQAMHDLRSGPFLDAYVAFQRVRQVDTELLKQQAQQFHDRQKTRMQSDKASATGSCSAEKRDTSLDSVVHSPSTVASPESHFGFDLPRQAQTDNQRGSDEGSTFLSGEASEAPPVTEFNSLIGTSMIFDPRLLQNVIIPSCRVLPLNLPGRDPYGHEYGFIYSGVYQSFQLSRWELMRSGISPDEVIGGPNVDIQALFSEERLNETHPMSQFVVRLMQTLRWDPITKLALMHLRYRMMRWMVFPSEETWDLLPSIMKPTQTQLRVPHPIWVDFLIVPKCRDMFILRPETRSFEWYVASDTAKVSWDGTLEEATQSDPSTGASTLSAKFLQQIEDSDNVTLSESAVAAFPQLEGNIRTRRN